MKFHSVGLSNFQIIRFISEKGGMDYVIVEEISMGFLYLLG